MVTLKVTTYVAQCHVVAIVVEANKAPSHLLVENNSVSVTSPFVPTQEDIPLQDFIWGFSKPYRSSNICNNLSKANFRGNLCHNH